MCESNHYITVSEDEENEDHGSERTIQSLQATWNFVKPCTAEDGIKGKWFCIVYGTKQSLLVRKLLKRFLEDENGPVESLKIRCLKPKTGSGTVVLEDTHESLPDIGLFYVISGPLEVILVTLAN